MKCGLIQIYYGDGKGKTTAALGQALRCSGRNFNVLFTSFLKNEDSGEFFVELPFDIKIPDYKYGFWHTLTDCQKSDAKELFENNLMDIIANAREYDMIIFDELLDAVALGCVDKYLVLDFLRSKPCSTEIVITGHYEDDDIFELADCITKMKKIRHHFDKGFECRVGIEK